MQMKILADCPTLTGQLASSCSIPINGEVSTGLCMLRLLARVLVFPFLPSWRIQLHSFHIFVFRFRYKVRSIMNGESDFAGHDDLYFALISPWNLYIS